MSRQHMGSPPPTRGSGFTLVELMVTIAVLAIIASIAIPSMRSLIASNRLAAMSTDVVASLQLARSEAIRRNAPVTVCSSSDGASCQASTDWSRWIVIGHDNVAAADDVVRDTSVSGGMQVSGPAAGIRFKPTGLLDAQEAVTVCLPVASPADNQRVVNLMIGGGVVTSKNNGAGACP